MTRAMEECGNCGDDFLDWDLEPGENQPPGMPGGALCRPCWDVLAKEVWDGIEAEERANEVAYLERQEAAYLAGKKASTV